MNESTTKQWTIDDFKKRNPVYRVNGLQFSLLAVALFPFAFSLCYFVGCQIRALSNGDYHVLMASSLVAAGVMVAAVCIIAVEWIKALHYSNLRKTDNALSKCQDLLRAALQDADLVCDWVRREKSKPSFIRRLKRTVISASEGSRVEMYDDELVFSLIEQWIRRGGAGQVVVSTNLRATQGTANSA